jgi:hypothetical protein
LWSKLERISGLLIILLIKLVYTVGRVTLNGHRDVLFATL